MGPKWYDDAVSQLEDDFSLGQMDIETFNREMAELQREYPDAAQQAAERAYNEELDQW